MKKSLGLELGQLRCRVRYDASIYGLEDGAHELGRVLVALDRLFNLRSWCVSTWQSTPTPTALTLYVLLLAGELARVARAPHPDGKVVSKEQEEAANRCTMVEGIDAEVEATVFIVQLLSKLFKLSFLVL